MLLGRDRLQRDIVVALWMLRVLWALTLLSPMVLYACATWLTDSFTEAIARGATWIGWVDGPPWGMWLVAATLSISGLIVPPALYCSPQARLSKRALYDIDLCRPGPYRRAPGLVPRLLNASIRAAATRYAAGLTLSLAMLGAVVLLCIWGFATPLKVSGLGFCCRYFWRPVDYLPVVALVSALVATLFPTQRRMLRELEKADTNGA
jgi:hypothetical protein